jgi:hypothetical protein
MIRCSRSCPGTSWCVNSRIAVATVGIVTQRREPGVLCGCPAGGAAPALKARGRSACPTRNRSPGCCRHFAELRLRRAFQARQTAGRVTTKTACVSPPDSDDRFPCGARPRRGDLLRFGDQRGLLGLHRTCAAFSKSGNRQSPTATWSGADPLGHHGRLARDACGESARGAARPGSVSD